jgi:hypothetical protein
VVKLEFVVAEIVPKVRKYFVTCKADKQGTQNKPVTPFG